MWQTKTSFLSNLIIFYPVNAYFGAKLSIFAAVLTKITTVYGCRLDGYQWKFIVSSSERYMKPWRLIKERFVVQHHYILPSQPFLFWKKGMMRVLDKNSTQEYRRKTRTPCCLPSVWHRPLNDIPWSHVGTCMCILPYAMILTKRIPTSQIALSVYLVPGR